MRVDNLKLVRKFNQPWELYDMEKDRTELHDLAARNRPLVQRMEKEFDTLARATGVEDWNLLLPKLLAAWQMTDAHG